MDDLISRQAAIDAFDGLPNCPNGYSDTYDKACIIGALEDLPSAQPEVTEEAVKEYCRKRCLCIVDSALIKKYASAQPKKGKWEGFNADKDEWKRTDGSPIFMSCSLCDGTVLNNGSAHWNFCPNCGADMRGKEDE